MSRDEAREGEIRRLYRARPRSAFVRWSCFALLALIAASWSLGGFGADDPLAVRRLANGRRFLGELLPYPLQGGSLDLAATLTTTGSWLRTLWWERGGRAARSTLAIAIVAIALAGLAGLAASPAAARTLATADPFLPALVRPSRSRRAFWWGIVNGTRAGLIFVRAIPEYVWAFFLLALFGPTAWPAVLALAIHNSGILGKLTAEALENLDPAPAAALRQLGAGRAQIAVGALLPAVLPRFLLFFFYRFETCVREATVLGMLGMASLGHWIVDARARNHYDEMLFFVLVGAALVFVGDLASALARELVRRAG